MAESAVARGVGGQSAIWRGLLLYGVLTATGVAGFLGIRLLGEGLPPIEGVASREASAATSAAPAPAATKAVNPLPPHSNLVQ